MTPDLWNRPPGIAGFACGPDVVLFRRSTGDLFLLNETAGHVWSGLEAGLTPGAVCQAVSDATNAPLHRVADDVRALLDEWDRLAASKPEPGDPDDADIVELNTRARRRAAMSAGAYRLLDFAFTIRVEHWRDVEASIALFGHLSAERFSVATAFDVVRDGQRSRCLVENARLLGRCDGPEGLAPLLHAHILTAAYARHDHMAALHAAVVVAGRRAILMPAESGSGKSTLTAALVAAGYGYCTDDLAILTSPPVRICPAPVGIGLKEGSWAPLASKLPRLGELAVHVRSDGQRIRYFVPPIHRIAPLHRRYSVAAIVFPRYVKDEEPSCRRIRPGQALLRVALAGYDAHLNSSVVAALTEWLGDLPAYELRFSDLDAAVSAIEGIT